MGSAASLIGLVFVASTVGGAYVGMPHHSGVRAAGDVTALYLDNITDGHVAGYTAGQALVLQGDELNWARGEEYGRRPCAPPAGVSPPPFCDGWMEAVYSGVRRLDDPDKTWSAGFAAPIGEKLAVGTYTGAVYPADRSGDQPGINVGLYSGGYCLAPIGRFTIHEISWSGSDLDSFSASFRQICAGTQEVWGPLWGEVRYNASSGFKAAVTSPPVLDLGQTDTGSETARQDVTITSEGTEPIQLGTATITGPDAGSFAVEADTCSGASLPPGHGCILSLSARPETNGNIEAALVVPDDTVRGERNVRLEVEGLGEADATAAITPSKFYPVVDRYRDTLLIEGTRAEAVEVHVAVRAMPSGDLVEETTLPAAASDYRTEWDGRSHGGGLVPSGDYDVAVTLSDAVGNRKVVKKTIKLSHDYVTWKQKSVTLDANRISLWGRSRNARISFAGSSYPRGVRLISNKGFAAVIYAFPVVQKPIYGGMKFKVYGRSVNRHKAVVAIWNPALGGKKDLGNYDVAKKVGPKQQWWKTGTSGQGRQRNGKVRAAVMVWKGLGGTGKSVFDLKRVRLDYAVGQLHAVDVASVATVPRSAPPARTTGRTVRTLTAQALPSLAPAPTPPPDADPAAEPPVAPDPLAVTESPEPAPTSEVELEQPTPAPEPDGEQPSAEPAPTSGLEAEQPTPEPKVEQPTLALEPNQPPVADAGGPYEVEEGSKVRLDGRGSHDPDGGIVAHEWSKPGRLDDASRKRPWFTGADDGRISIELTVTDEDGATATDKTTVKVTNVAPSLGPFGPYELPVGERLALGPVPVTDPGPRDTHEAQVAWGDGHSSPAVVHEDGTVVDSHTYRAAGTYVLMLTVTDDDGSVGQAMSTVTVVPVAAPPVATDGDPDASVDA